MVRGAVGVIAVRLRNTDRLRPDKRVNFIAECVHTVGECSGCVQLALE